MTPWTGRFWTLLDPTYAKRFIPIVVSEGRCSIASRARNTRPLDP